VAELIVAFDLPEDAQEVRRGLFLEGVGILVMPDRDTDDKVLCFRKHLRIEHFLQLNTSSGIVRSFAHVAGGSGSQRETPFGLLNFRLKQLANALPKRRGFEPAA